MLVSHRKRFIYTKTAKTGGTSVEVYFEPYCMPEGVWEFSDSREVYVGPAGIIGYRGEGGQGALWRNHMSAVHIRRQLGEDVWQQYFKFCVVRNPFDKLVSAFHFFNHNGQSGPGKPVADMALNGKLKDRFREWLSTAQRYYDGNKYLIDGRICVDYFIRYEDLMGGMRHVCQTLDIPFQPEQMRRLKGGYRPADVALGDYYDNEAINLVSQLYRFELEHFGYAPPL